MRLIFMGNPIFAIPTLSLLHHSQHDLIAVVTNPDKPRGRGRRYLPTAVAKFASENSIPILKPASLKDNMFQESIQEMNADLFIVVAFKILPKSLLKIPAIGSVNLHPSVLPKYRGAAPIQWVLMNGKSKTGLTTFFLKPKVDTGDIILQKKVVIFPDDDGGNLSHRMSRLGAHIMLDTINLIVSGKFQTESQKEEKATNAPKITPEICCIDWLKSAFEVHNLIRALSPVPAAYTFLMGKRLKILESSPSSRPATTPGEVVECNHNQLVVSCGVGCIKILDVQLEGKQRMSVEKFLLGARIKSGFILG